MLAFLDESGDAGMKLSHGSSGLFVLAMVLFSNEEAAHASHAIAELRTRMSLPKSFEFHFGVNSKRQREAFLGTVGRLRFRTHVVAVDKSRLVPDRLEGQSLYLWTLGMLLESAGPELDGARLVIDGLGSRGFKREIAAFVRRSTGDSNATVGDVRLQPAHQNSLLQVADYVASVSARALNAKADGAQMYDAHLRKHEASFRVWP